MIIKYFGTPGSSFFITSFVNDPVIEEGVIEINAPRPIEGEWHLSHDGEGLPGNQNTELNWISNELEVIKEQVLLHEDSDPLAIATELDWREYRKQLRRWDWHNEYFPNPEYRPVRPK